MGMGLRAYIFEKYGLPWNFVLFYCNLWKFQTKQSFTLETPQNCVMPLGNFKAKNKDPWKFHMIFS